MSLNLKQFTPPVPKKPIPKLMRKPESVPTPVEQIAEPVPVEKVEPVTTQKLMREKGLFIAKKSEEENRTTSTKVEQPKPTAKAETQLPKAETQLPKMEKPKKTHPKKPIKQAKSPATADPLAAALMGFGEAVQPIKPKKPKVTYTEQKISRLYGREFLYFSREEQKFIRRHLSEIHRITQNTLTHRGYPRDAVILRRQGLNVVSFYLHPNGDISSLQLETKMGYAVLDQNTLEVIKTAYKNYPLPKTKTKIKFDVMYELY